MAFSSFSPSLFLRSDLRILREEKRRSTDTCVGGRADRMAATFLRSSRKQITNTVARY